MLPRSIFVLVLSAAFLQAQQVERLENLTDQFRRTNGWTGGDGVYSIPLNKETNLWLFSDSWVGEIRDNRHHQSRLINNSVALQPIQKASETPPQFYFRSDSSGPQSFLVPEDGKGWYWLFHGERNPEGLFFFLNRLEKPEKEQPNSAWNFRMTGNLLAVVSNPDDPPLAWNIKQVPVPAARMEKDQHLFFGSAVMRHGEHCYIYGTGRTGGFLSGRRGMILARTASSDLSDFSRWEYFGENGWSSNPDQVQVIASGLPTEYSVSWMESRNKFVAVFTGFGISGRIQCLQADRPEGPWGDPLTLYECPEKEWNKSFFCYAAKAHPQLSGEGLVISYVCNSHHFPDMVKDARIYWPVFVSWKDGQ